SEKIEEHMPNFGHLGIQKQQVLQTLKGVTTQSGKSTFWMNLEVAEGVGLEETIAKLKKEKTVLVAEPDVKRSISSLVPNDPRFNEQWHHQAINTVAAWDHLDSKGAAARGDSSVVVAVIDTGINTTHEDLKNNLWVNSGEIPGNNTDDDGNGYVDDVYGANVIDANKNGAISDDNGHGTHVSGIVAATANNGVGVSGVAPNVKIMTVKAGDKDGWFSAADIAEAVSYAIKNGADVINMSFGGLSETIIENEQISSAAQQAVLVAAAGNESMNYTTEKSYPAAFPEVLGVMAAQKELNDSGGYLADYSNFDDVQDGTGYQIMAPGSSILSTYVESNTSYGLMSGTSMASPVVAGAAALVKSLYPEQPTSFIKNLLIEQSEKKQGTATHEYPYLNIETVVKNTASISLSDSALSFDALNGTQSLSVSAVPTKASVEVLWESSDEKVATVDETGTVTAVGEGQATITATSVYGGSTATTSVEVSGTNESNPSVYTVTFDSNGGSAVDAQMIEEGALITKPSDPTRSGYGFAGWYKEDTFDTVWDFNNDVVTADITLYAKWEEVESRARITDVKIDEGGYAGTEYRFDMTAETTGSQVLYQVAVEDLSRGVWIFPSGYSEESVQSWVPEKPGEYRIRTRVKDAYSVNSQDSRIDTFITVKNPRATITDVKIDEGGYAGTEYRFDMMSSSPSGEILYQVAIEDLTRGVWIFPHSYNGNNIQTWKPEKPGEYRIRTRVKDAYSVNSQDSRIDTFVTVKNPRA
ncbi:MAG TPA: hypothetical protein DHN33_01220, partial [Eubacteriaceae bacterium]|nr:hypothetical protein [Eubacteriaceae bacterium]